MSDYARQQVSTPDQDVVSANPILSAASSFASGLMSPVGALGMQGLMGNSGVSGLLSGVGGGLSGIGTGLPGLGGLFGGDEESEGGWGPLGAAGEWLGNKAGEAMDWGRGAWDTVSGAASGAANWVGDKVSGAADWAGEQWSSAKDWAGGAWDSAKSWAGDKLDSAKQFGSDLWNGLGQEGFGGLFDPVGMMDRQAAQRELADRFDVVPDDFVGPRLPNQVTQAEFEKVAHTYSDIRLGRSDVEFNTEGLSEEEAAAFRSGSMNDLASIMQTEHGRQLVSDLAYNQKDHKTTLSPLFQKDSAGNYDPTKGLDTTNGFASAEDKSKAYMGSDGVTAGEGTNSRVRYNPGVNAGPPDGIDAWLPFRSDVLLYHELVHSRDHTLGTLAQGKDSATGENLREQRAAGLGAYKDEFISENAYRRDRRLIAAGGTGTRDGDATMPDRTSYFYHTAPAPAPGGGASTGSGSPGVAHDPHGHDHDDD